MCVPSCVRAVKKKKKHKKLQACIFARAPALGRRADGVSGSYTGKM